MIRKSSVSRIPNFWTIRIRAILRTSGSGCFESDISVRISENHLFGSSVTTDHLIEMWVSMCPSLFYFCEALGEEIVKGIWANATIISSKALTST